MSEPRRGIAAGVSLGFGAAVGAWVLAHVTSPIVRAWSPSWFPLTRLGDLVGRTDGRTDGREHGSGERAILLLHGLGATGDYWPGAYDVLAECNRVVVPDLLGFGRSIDEQRSTFELVDHLDAIDAALAAGAPDATDITIVAHSMGCGVALGVAARHADRVGRIVLIGAPIYPDPHAAEGAFAKGGVMGKAFLLDTKWAERVCAISCRHRRLSGWLMALGEPRMPFAIARRASLHTWPAYRDSVRSLILHHDWSAAFRALCGSGIEIELLHGSLDTIGDQTHIDRLLDGRPDIVRRQIDGAGHHLAISHSAEVLGSFTSRT